MRELYPSKEALGAALASGAQDGTLVTFDQLDELVACLAASSPAAVSDGPRRSLLRPKQLGERAPDAPSDHRARSRERSCRRRTPKVELRAQGHQLLHATRTAPWDQTVCRLLTAEGAISGISFAPWLHT